MRLATTYGSLTICQDLYSALCYNTEKYIITQKEMYYYSHFSGGERVVE